MSDRPVSVAAIIPAWNSAGYIAGAVDSVLRQTVPPAEVFVVDDGSTDATPDILKSFGDRITVIRHAANRGLPAARNSGIAAARSDLLAFLDADDEWLPEMIARQVAEFAAHPGLGLCFTDLVECDEDFRPIRARLGYRARHAEEVFDELYRDAFPMPPSTVFVRREVFERAGPFDESMLIKQDYECWLRIAMWYPVSCLPEPLCRRRVQSASLTQKSDAGRKLAYEKRLFELCGAAAARWGKTLPMPVADRIALSQRRRMREMLSYGEVAAAAVYRRELEATRRLTGTDRLLFHAVAMIQPARNAARDLKRRVLSRNARPGAGG